MGVTREPRDGAAAAALSAVPSSSAARSAAARSAAARSATVATSSSSALLSSISISHSSSSSSRKVKDRGARFNEKHALKYGLSICSRHAKDQCVEMVMCKFCVAFGKEASSEAPRKRRATANIKYFRAPFRADHYLSHLEINHKTKWDQYEHATMPEKELFFAANADPTALAPQSVVAMAAAAIEANQVTQSGDPTQNQNQPSESSTSPVENAWDAATAGGDTQDASLSLSRIVPVRLPASEIEKDVVEKLIGALFFNPHEEDGVTTAHALELFAPKPHALQYEIVIKNQRLFDLVIKCIATGASYRLASRLVYCVREETKLAHYGGCTDVRVANYVRAVLASNLQRIAWMMRAAWTYAIATETVQHQHTMYLDVRVRLWHNSGLRDFHVLAIPQFDKIAPPLVIERVRAVLDILDPRWRAKLLGTTAHGGIHTGREPRGLTGHQQGLAARLTGLVHTPHFYLVWSAVHQLEVVAKNAVTQFADQTFYDQLVMVVQTIRKEPNCDTLPDKHTLVSLPAAYGSPRGFVQTLLIDVRYLLRNRPAVTTLCETSHHHARLPKLTSAWWVCVAAAQRLIAEVEYFIHKLASLDAASDASVDDHVQELGKLALVLKDVVGATRDLVDVDISSSSLLSSSSPSPSAKQGSFLLSLHNTEQFLQNEGGSVAIDMLDQITDPLARTQLTRTIAAFAVDLLASVAAVAHEGRHYCADQTPTQTQVVVSPPRVLPYEVYHMGKDEFMGLVASQLERLRETFSPPEIRRIQNEYFFFLAAVETEPILSGILKTHGRDTDVSFAWSCLQSRFLYLQEFIGGLASVVPDAMSGTLYAELLYLNWDKPDYRLTTVDFALEGILHARQKMQIEVVDVNHLRAAVRTSASSSSSNPSSSAAAGGLEEMRRPAVAIETATPVGGSLVASFASVEEADDPMAGGDHAGEAQEDSSTASDAEVVSESVGDGGAASAGSMGTVAKKPGRLGEGYTIV